MIPRGSAARVAILALALAPLGCGAGDTEGTAERQARLGERGLVEFAAAPVGALVEGENRFRVELRAVETDEPLVGASLSVDAFMRSMGHGGNAAPEVREIGPGDYEVSDVVLSMPGLWELRMLAERDALADEVGFLFEVP